MVKEEPEDFKEVDKLYQSLVRALTEYEGQKYEEWDQTSVDTAREKLKMRLLRRMEKTGLLKVNFDPALVRLLREVRYFLLFGLEVPASALEMFSRADTYRKWFGQLDIIVSKYNSMLTELLPASLALSERCISGIFNFTNPVRELERLHTAAPSDNHRPFRAPSAIMRCSSCTKSMSTRRLLGRTSPSRSKTSSSRCV